LHSTAENMGSSVKWPKTGASEGEGKRPIAGKKMSHEREERTKKLTSQQTAVAEKGGNHGRGGIVHLHGTGN